jgi:hypothetical protein
MMAHRIRHRHKEREADHRVRQSQEIKVAVRAVNQDSGDGRKSRNQHQKPVRCVRHTEKSRRQNSRAFPRKRRFKTCQEIAVQQILLEQTPGQIHRERLHCRPKSQRAYGSQHHPRAPDRQQQRDQNGSELPQAISKVSGSETQIRRTLATRQVRGNDDRGNQQPEVGINNAQFPDVSHDRGKHQQCFCAGKH